VIGDLFDPTESDEKAEAALSFCKEVGVRETRGASSEQTELKATMRKVIAFSLVIDYVGTVVSLRQASHIFELHCGPHRAS
jgi:hypothetical protein